ncbi:MAG: phosphatase family protein [Candidatus Nomurabacteria bacterium]|jgi:undecaprenyl-diphosphatase|nr:phosphatase family protein [Candidatus Nomurabacteria bacterium]
MHNLNIAMLEFINGGAGYYHPLDVLFVIVTSYYTLIMVGLIVTYYIGIYIPWHQEGMARIRAFRYAGMAILAVSLATITSSIIKILVAYPRPFKTLTDLHVLITLPDSYSFPSGHATFTMALAVVVYANHRRLGTLLFAFAFVVGLSRVYVGVHYPIDVGVGFLIGYFIPKLFQLKGAFEKKVI